MIEKRIEILSRESTIAVPYRVPLWAYPHIGLMVVILLAWVVDFAMRVWGWWG